MIRHIPVFIEEVLKILNPQNKQKFIDATTGDGGYSEQIAKVTNNSVKILCLDQNLNSIKRAKKLIKNKKNIIFAVENFKNIKFISHQNNFFYIDGIYYDLGLASWQINESGLGISFSKNETLDMRLQTDDNFKKNRITAKEIINKFPVKKIADIFYQYGDVRNSWGIARRIELARREKRIENTFELVRAINSKNPKILAPIFQALRIYVNNEYENLEQSLTDAINLLNKNGKIIAISYHSGEDRIVKNLFRKFKKDGLVKLLTRKPLIPGIKEIKNNPRARSAKLRAIEKI